MWSYEACYEAMSEPLKLKLKEAHAACQQKRAALAAAAATTQAHVTTDEWRTRALASKEHALLMSMALEENEAMALGYESLWLKAKAQAEAAEARAAAAEAALAQLRATLQQASEGVVVVGWMGLGRGA